MGQGVIVEKEDPAGQAATERGRRERRADGKWRGGGRARRRPR